MATLVRDIQRPAFLDPPADQQFAVGDALAGRALTPASARLDTRRGGEATLDELLVGAWEGLSARRPVACPVCSGAMKPRAGAAGGGCGDCGSQLR